MKPTELILIRHGETGSNLEFRLCGWTDVPMTPRGLEQARLLGRHVAEVYPPDLLYSSPLERARLTARQISQQIGMPIDLVEGLKEIHFGACEGLTETEFRGRYPDLAHATDAGWRGNFAWPDGESRDTFHRRVRTTIEALVDGNPGRRIAAVSHGGTIASYLSWLLAGGPDQWRQYLVANCAITRVIFGSGQPTVHPLNETGFLAALSFDGAGAMSA